MDASWQNPSNALDVDNSKIASQEDFQQLVSLLVKNGISHLTGPRPNGEIFCDVNGDGLMSPMDLHVLANNLLWYNEDLFAQINLSTNDDNDGNGVVLKDGITLHGKSLANVKLEVDHYGDASSHASPIAIMSSDANGNFVFDVTLTSGVNHFLIRATDPLGRSSESSKVIRRGDVVSNWNATALKVIESWTTTSNDPTPGRAVPSEPPRVARNLAMIHTAMFDAINAFEGSYTSYLSGLNAPQNASSIAAMISAAHRVSSTLYASDAAIAKWNAAMQESLAEITNIEAKDRGLEFGIEVGDAMLKLRQNDGSDIVVEYTVGTEAGQWRRTPPGFLPPLLPQWPAVETFGIPSVEAFRVPEPPSLESSEYAIALNEVLALGRRDSSTRTVEQTAIAVFWADGGGTFTPPGHWNQIAADVLASDPNSLNEHARTLSLLNLALADAGIVSWDAKYRYEIWRPIDAIRRATSDNNPLTQPDSEWLPLIVTPPFPAYTSGHSSFSGAASQILTELLGPQSFTAHVHSSAASGLGLIDPQHLQSRVFSSFEEAANEAGMSRIYGGIHFAFDNAEGLASGREIASYIARNYLTAIES